MIPQTVERDITRIGNFTEQSMGIAQGSEAFIFRVLRKNIYSDAITSLIREYLANALDEHVKFQKLDVPVELTFPTHFSNEFRVRDFGQGLKDEDVFHFFGNYGASDKRDSNQLIGMYGLGCKSAFAYTDSFSVISYKDGRASTFSVYIDETDVGKVAKLTEQNTDAPNGVEIVVPVKSADINTFQTRGVELLKYVKTKPVIKGLANPPSLNRVEPPVKGNAWRYFGDGRGTTIIQGQIGYPVDTNKMGSIWYSNGTAPNGYVESWEVSLMRSGLEIEVEIGEVEVTASREQLQMEKKTIDAIRKRLSTIRDEITALVEAKFKSAKTLFEAKQYYYEFFQKGGSYGSTLASSIGKINWNGIVIDSSTIRLSNTPHRLMEYSQNYRGNVTYRNAETLYCHDDIELVYDDTDRKAFMYKRRAKTLLDAGKGKVLILQTDDEKALLQEIGIDTKKLKQLSSVTPTVLNSTRIGNGANKSLRAKHQVNVFELDLTELRTGYKGTKSDFWKVATITPAKQVYIPIDRFVPQSMGKINSIYSLREVVLALDIIGLPINFPIYGIKPKQSVGQMVRFDHWLKEFIKTIPNLAEEAALIQQVKRYTALELFIDEAELPAKSKIKAYRQLYDKARKLGAIDFPYDGAKQKVPSAKNLLVTYGEIELPKKQALLEASEEIKKVYPLLSKFRQDEQKFFKDSLVDYINMVFKVKGE